MLESAERFILSKKGSGSRDTPVRRPTSDVSQESEPEPPEPPPSLQDILEVGTIWDWKPMQMM
jgi:hypothetical protein